jgi:21S rRNA (uridine2791-2'-O)-methyltransferase
MFNFSRLKTSTRVHVRRVMPIRHGYYLQRAVSEFSANPLGDHVRHVPTRFASSKRWVERQSKDHFARAARVEGLKSRAAFKLLQINEKYHLFKPGQTVLDLGYAPGSWSQVRAIGASPFVVGSLEADWAPLPFLQVAIDLTKPNGRVVGVDLIPAQPPKGVSTIQGDFLSSDVQRDLKVFLHDPNRGRSRRKELLVSSGNEDSRAMTDEVLQDLEQGYIDLERRASRLDAEMEEDPELDKDKSVDVVLSDMCEPWEQTTGFWKRSLSDPYLRMMNTSGNNFRDHAGSMVSGGITYYFSVTC